MECAQVVEKIVFLLLVVLFIFRGFAAIARLREGKIGTSSTKKLSEFRNRKASFMQSLLHFLHNNR